ncbi:MAG: NAD-dependent DNA ligase LigA [Lachnospiraceae bacterium]|nr:NAD-dependent DNA ligase LigA [Lachnospiraceae bacterium]
MDETETKIARMRELGARLLAASKAYYQEDREIMSNLEYDKLYDELVQLEQDTGTVLSGSPTVTVGYEAVDELPKERHEAPMLSLDKTKDVGALADFAGEHEVLLSWKLDGLTVVLTYENGALFKAVTRGNGEVGEVITNNARVFQNVPLKIPHKGTTVLRGEAVIRYSDFERINREIDDEAARYKNPRNLCSGSVRQLNNEITAQRCVYFYAFALVRADGVDFGNSREKQFLWMREQGFDVVEYKKVTGSQVPDAVRAFSEAITQNDFPSDGLVSVYEDIAYGQSLGRTAKFPRDSYAFKWQDEQRETHLVEIEWSPSRTGLINPVAVFEPVELEGTTVSRASVHNVSILKALRLGIGDEITVYKANMIIPQIAENRTGSGNAPIPERCPVCGGLTRIESTGGVESLYCTNPDCQAKKIKAFTLFVSRDAMNIDGLSEMTLEKLIGKGFIHEYSDLFHLDRHRDEIVEMEGFGEKSYENLIGSAEKARRTTLSRVIYSLGISNIGLANAKLLCREYQDDLTRLRSASAEELSGIPGIGGVIGASVEEYFRDAEHNRWLDDLMDELFLYREETDESAQTLTGKVFVITGSLTHFPNRNALKNLIESKGGKVTGSVTSKTDFLINNDVLSSSSKNKKAKELGVEIISEQDFLDRYTDFKEESTS